MEMGLKRSRFNECNVIAFKDESYSAWTSPAVIACMLSTGKLRCLTFGVGRLGGTCREETWLLPKMKIPELSRSVTGMKNILVIPVCVKMLQGTWASKCCVRQEHELVPGHCDCLQCSCCERHSLHPAELTP